MFSAGEATSTITYVCQTVGEEGRKKAGECISSHRNLFKNVSG